MPATVYPWNKAPFIRLLPALIGRIVLQWQLPFSFGFLAACFLVCLTSVILYSLLPLNLKFRLGALNGIGTILSFLFFGALLVRAKDIRHNKEWIGHNYRNNSFVIAAPEEPLAEKPNSFFSKFYSRSYKGFRKNSNGKIIIYFKKDSLVNQLRYGSLKEKSFLMGVYRLPGLLHHPASCFHGGRPSTKKIIVYNVPKYQAIGVVVANTYHFMGDPALLFDDFIRNIHIQPSGIANRLPLPGERHSVAKTLILPINMSQYLIPLYNFRHKPSKQNIDLLILSKNPRIYLSSLATSFSIGRIVIDGPAPPWQARLWKSDCDPLHLPCHDLSEKGAFVMNL